MNGKSAGENKKDRILYLRRKRKDREQCPVYPCYPYNKFIWT